MKKLREIIEKPEKTHGEHIIDKLHSMDPYETMMGSDVLKSSIPHAIFGKYWGEMDGNTHEEKLKSSLEYNRDDYDKYFKDRMKNCTKNIRDTSQHDQNGRLILHRVLKHKDLDTLKSDISSRGDKQGNYWTWTDQAKGGYHVYGSADQHTATIKGTLRDHNDIDFKNTHRQMLDPKHYVENEIRLKDNTGIDGVKITHIDNKEV